MILCDGMGTGRPAAVDGNLAAELTARLLKAGFTAELAARLVNVALALKSDEESGATLDLVSVDLYTGTARLFKAGLMMKLGILGAGMIVREFLPWLTGPESPFKVEALCSTEWSKRV